MIFDPITRTIYTDNGELIKKMNCPYKVHWDNLEINNSKVRMCNKCDREIINTEYISDDELLDMIKNNPDTCLKIDLNQNNIKIINNVFFEQK
jgi:hypothetical protein